MSFQNFQKAGNRPQQAASGITFEQLDGSVKELKSFVEKIEAATKQLGAGIDHKLMTKVVKTQATALEKLKKCKENHAAHKSRDPTNRLAEPLSSEISRLEGRLTSLKPKIQKLEEEHRLALEREREEEEQRAKTAQLEMAQEQEDEFTRKVNDQAAEMEYLEREAVDIAQQAQEFNDLTKQVNAEIVKQSEVIQKVDDTIEEAKDEMVEGNSELEVAEEHQKSTTKTLLWILGIVVLVAVVAVVIVVAV